MNIKNPDNRIVHIVAIALFLLLPAIYFFPQLSGEKLYQHDTMTATGMAKEIADYNKINDTPALWTNSMFGGMPSYLIGLPAYSLITPIYKLTTLFDWRPISFVFLYLLGFYIALILFGVSPMISLIGSFAFAFSSYNFIIIAAGHNTKAIAIGFMAPLIAGVYFALKKNVWLGSALFSLFLALQIYANHLQITYYTLLIILILGITELISAYKLKNISAFFGRVAIISLFALLAIASNIDKLWTTYEYGHYSMRGKSDLTNDQQNKTSGLDKDYATGWSYGIDETLSLLIPNIKGGASAINFGEDSYTSAALKQNNVPNSSSIIKQLPGYWGTQPGTSGPVYAGAIVVFLFILSLFLVNGPIRYWIIASTIFSVILAWGRNMMPVTDFFLDYFPGYNKFRTVSMILVIASFALPLMASIGLQKVVNNEIETDKFKKGLIWSLALTGGIAFIYFLFPGLSGSFVSVSDSQYPEWLRSSFIQDRTSFLRADAIRSVVLILISGTLIFAYTKKAVKINVLLIAMFLLIIFDLWSVNKRYLNNDNFIQQQVSRNQFPLTNANKEILKDKDEFRVLNLSADPFSEVSTSYYHHSIGGYHGAKMRRYQEVIDFKMLPEIQELSKRLNEAKSQNDVDSAFFGLNVLNMLNTKYIIFDPGKTPLKNEFALGDCWIARKLNFVDNADQEIALLKTIDPSSEIIVNKTFKNLFDATSFKYDSTASLKLLKYTPNGITYHYSGKGNQLAVFSEIYYPKGWNAYVNGKSLPYFQANYLLRAMILSEGNYDIAFKFEPSSYFLGRKISVVSSIFLFIILGFVLISFTSMRSKLPGFILKLFKNEKEY